MPHMTIPVVWSDDCLLHVPGGEVWVGVRTPGTEVPERLEAIRAALAEAGHPFVPATAHGDEPVLAVHDAALLDYLADAYTDWVAAGFPDDPGQDRVVGYLFPTPGLLSGLPLRTPAAAHARAGRFCYDTMTLVGPDTYRAARASADTALTAVDLVGSGAPVAYAACRPPGHHVTRDAFGGSCYLNNAAIAAQALRSAGHDRVAVIDVDAHHGNGTQSIFYDRADVLVTSVHVDPGAGWFPHYLGFADETGRGAGEGANLNLPLPRAPATRGGWPRSVPRSRRSPGSTPAPWCSRSVWTRRPTTPRARCGSPPRGTTAPRGRSRLSASRSSPSRRAATTCRPSGGSWPRRWTASLGE